MASLCKRAKNGEGLWVFSQSHGVEGEEDEEQVINGGFHLKIGTLLNASKPVPASVGWRTASALRFVWTRS